MYRELLGWMHDHDHPTAEQSRLRALAGPSAAPVKPLTSHTDEPVAHDATCEGLAECQRCLGRGNTHRRRGVRNDARADREGHEQEGPVGGVR